METNAAIPADRAIWLRRRRTTRRALFGFTLLFAAFMAPFLWLSDQEDKQNFQEAAQYQQDCAKSAVNSPDCQFLTMRVYEHRAEGILDPDDETHLWLGLQSKSGQKFEVDTCGPQWHRLRVGDQVTALVWNGEVQEVSDSGGTERMRTNPTQKAEARLSPYALKLMALIVICLVLAFIAADKWHEKQWSLKSGNAGGG